MLTTYANIFVFYNYLIISKILPKNVTPESINFKKFIAIILYIFNFV